MRTVCTNASTSLTCHMRTSLGNLITNKLRWLKWPGDHQDTSDQPAKDHSLAGAFEKYNLYVDVATFYLSTIFFFIYSQFEVSDTVTLSLWLDKKVIKPHVELLSLWSWFPTTHRSPVNGTEIRKPSLDLIFLLNFLFWMGVAEHWLPSSNWVTRPLSW